MRLSPNRSGFTLPEVMMSVVLVGLISAFSYGSLLSANRFAMQSRLHTLAEGIARDRIDRVQSVTPFNPHFPQPQIPADLVLGKRVENDIPLYVDPATGAATVTARVETEVKNVGTLNTRLAAITVIYSFTGKEHRVQMNTLRTSDS